MHEQRYLSPKEVQARMYERGVRYSVPYWRAALRECPGAIKRGRLVLWSTIWEWWLLHPDWAPFGRPGTRQKSLLS